jgi:glucosamine-phosphate N-acetyltransferase
MEIIFRKIEKGDYYKKYFDLLNQLTIAPICTIDNFEKVINNLHDHHIILVCEINDKIIASGTLLIEPKLIRNCGFVGHIEDIVVDKKYNGCGIGKKLIGELNKYAEYNKCYKIILDCNKDIVFFYEKCGFVKKEDQMVKYL